MDWLKFFACFFFGFFGVHKFIEKKPLWGLVYLFTCGLFGFGWIFDCIKYFIIAIKNSSSKVNLKAILLLASIVFVSFFLLLIIGLVFPESSETELGYASESGISIYENIQSDSSTVSSTQSSSSESSSSASSESEISVSSNSSSKSESSASSNSSSESKNFDSGNSSSSKAESSSSNSSSSNSVIVPTESETGENLVWVPTNGGEKYHSKKSCSNMKDPVQITKESAKARGYTACGRCY